MSGGKKVPSLYICSKAGRVSFGVKNKAGFILFANRAFVFSFTRSGALRSLPARGAFQRRRLRSDLSAQKCEVTAKGERGRNFHGKKKLPVLETAAEQRPPAVSSADNPATRVRRVGTSVTTRSGRFRLHNPCLYNETSASPSLPHSACPHRSDGLPSRRVLTNQQQNFHPQIGCAFRTRGWFLRDASAALKRKATEIYNRGVSYP